MLTTVSYADAGSRSLPENSRPIVIPERVEVVRRTNTISGQPSFTNGHTNGTTNGVEAPSKRKRDADEAELDVEQETKKRGRVLEQPVKTNGHHSNGNGDDVIHLDDDAGGGGAIMIDDD